MQIILTKIKILMTMRFKVLLNNINTIKTFIKNYHLIFLGLSMFSIFIYFRFLRERLPRDIPFNLSVLGFFILVEICCIYVYIIWSYIRPPKKPNDIITIIVDTLFVPLDALDNAIKDLYYIKLFYPKVLIWIAHKGIRIFQTTIFETCFFIIPRIILISVFLVDIFYFSKLNYIYYVLVSMGVILFIRRYFIYSLNKFIQQLLNILKLDIKTITTTYEFGIHPSEWPENFNPEEENDDYISETMALDVNIFVEYYVRKKVYEDYEPNIDFLWQTKHFYKKYLIKNDTEKELEKLRLKKKLKELCGVAILKEHIKNISQDNKYIKISKIVIFSLYLICWVYILIKSIHTLNILELIEVLNTTWLKIPEAFSNINIFYK